ncbi:hypothetical protein X566_15450 [Afipia sp. P52-10]|uniref:regulatory protein GemA n=1 Tax=Afipia sp. P52-10 TaxID=1429916 RepID=UPI0003DF0F15|nr:regulatory protein GemA [Afipia sp. P52-10]ETR78887.1 hypothetical protein X566_15450 [Afipia sp. P52-10]
MNRIAMVTNGQLATIHMLATRAGFDDETYRDFLTQQTGHHSAKDLTAVKASLFIDRLRERTGLVRTPGAIAGLDSPIAAKLRALWIAGYNLGIVTDRTDRAMLSFLERQCGVSHTRFLKTSRDGTVAVEGMKSWLERAAKVAWPADSADVIANKRAVINAQWMRLVEIGAVRPLNRNAPLEDLDLYAFRVARLNGWMFFQQPHYDQVQTALGRKLRAALDSARKDR